MNINIINTSLPKPKPNSNELGFGKHFTDHMFVMEYKEGEWCNPAIKPFEPIALNPSAMIYHYAISTFEGMKAYRRSDGKIQLFRPEENFKRLNKSNDRMCIPEIDVETAMQGLRALLDIERDWIPNEDDTSLYIRPFVIATDPFLGVKPAEEFMFIIILSPVGSYYKGGMKPTNILVESNYVRAVKGGTGTAKTGGNYSGSIKAQMEAKKRGFDQVLWLDAVEKKYVEEVGTSNAFFVIDDKVVTPALSGSILHGITRDSVINLLKSEGHEVIEREIEIQEVFDAHKDGRLKEVFATGTAAVISPIGKLSYNDNSIVINNNNIGPVAQHVYKTITNIQKGIAEDEFNWTVLID